MKNASFSSFMAASSALLLLSNCGFQPVYGSAAATENAITVLQIDSRMGHRLRQELTRELGSGIPSVEPGAFLTVRLSEQLNRLALKSNAGVSRTNLVGAATYELRDLNGEVLLVGTVSAQTDYDVADTDYGDIALQTDARERVAFSLAQTLHQQLLLDISSNRQTLQKEQAAQKALEATEEVDDPLEAKPPQSIDDDLEFLR